MKRAILLIISLSLLFGLSGCGESGRAKTALSEALGAVRSMDVPAIESLWGNGTFRDLGSDEEDEAAKEQSTEMMSIVVKNLSYKIISTKVSGDTATVKTEVTNCDMKTLMPEFVEQSYSAALDYALLPKEQQPSDEEINRQNLDLMSALLSASDAPKVTTTVDISLRLVNGVWVVEPDDAVLTAIYGGILSMTDAMNSAFKEKALK